MVFQKVKNMQLERSKGENFILINFYFVNFEFYCFFAYKNESLGEKEIIIGISSSNTFLSSSIRH